MVNKSKGVDTRLLFVFNLHHFIKYLFSWEIMPFLAIFSFAFILMPFSTLMFGIVKILVLLMVYKMAFDVLADVARGNMTPTAKHNYLVSNAVGVKVAMLVLLIELTKIWLEGSDSFKSYTQDFTILMTFITPAIYMSLAITDSLPRSLNPLVLFKIIKTAYISYFLFVLFWMASIYLRETIINPFIFDYLPNFIDGIITSFIEFSLLMINFQIMGYILYQNRREFELHQIAGFYALDDDILIPAKDEKDPEINPYHERIKSLLVDDNIELAMSMVVELQQDGDNSPELVKLYQRAMDKKLNDSTPYAVAQKVHILISKKQDKKAFEKVVEQFEHEKPYVEHSANDIYPLLEYAMSVNKLEYIPKLIHKFVEKYPNHMDTVANYFILAKAIYRVRENRWESKAIIEKLIKNFPNDPLMSEIKAWYKGMQLIENRDH